MSTVQSTKIEPGIWLVAYSSGAPPVGGDLDARFGHPGGDGPTDIENPKVGTAEIVGEPGGGDERFDGHGSGTFPGYPVQVADRFCLQAMRL